MNDWPRRVKKTRMARLMVGWRLQGFDIHEYDWKAMGSNHQLLEIAKGSRKTAMYIRRFDAKYWKKMDFNAGQ